MARRTKICCTLGPATSTAGAIGALVDAGMDVARLNLSHGTHADHAALYERVRAASDASGRAVGVLADLQGPKIRVGRFAGGAAVLAPGSRVVVTPEDGEGDSGHLSISYDALARELAPGDTLLLDDGMLKLCAVSSDGRSVSCEVVEGGPVSDHKGVNFPGANLRAPALTEKDAVDLAFALGLGVDLVALSFVREASDAAAVRSVMDAFGRRVPVIAKIEKPEAVDRLDAIATAFDGLMVARGDLGIEVSAERVPLVQKDIAQIGRDRGKPVIVATHLLESMTHRSRPTRAEASDVANAVLDGADMLMFSGETSVGEHPVEVVATASRIAATIEEHALARMPPVRPAPSPEDAVAAAATGIAVTVGARAVAVFTQSGRTAQRVASHRSAVPVVAFTTEQAVRSRLAAAWGVETFLGPLASGPRAAVAQVNDVLLRHGRGVPGERVVVVAGRPGQSGTTNTVLVHELAWSEQEVSAW
ncbi:MAG TPA: pyruvate kinase [Acidimicrobiales bacterium]|nr:pyruvate kinase [Acidimicrobiales bacterium]